ncbi:MAG: lipoprotein-anchoring transpeptidase ErfK/SrfK [Verrucomicrobiales bacterium]|jgi:lipoprotein-anchoring transpeptidase ErfK/SrfK
MNSICPLILRTVSAVAVVLLLCQCANHKRIVVSVAQQRMILTDKGKFVKSYPVSTSKFGTGDVPGSKKTPLGTMRIADKIGGGSRSGTVFKGRKKTGEVLKPNSQGRDPIVTRILWLKGTQSWNRNAYWRYIYIHGTPEEWRIGSRASYGCIRMKSRDVIDLYRRVKKGTPVVVVPSYGA